MGPATKDNFRDILDEVKADGNLKTYQMEDLRDAAGYSKLGKYVREEIEEELRAQGLRSYPEELPKYSDTRIRLFIPNTDVAELIDAVTTPSSEGDELVREAVSESQPSENLQKAQKKATEMLDTAEQLKGLLDES